MFFCCRRKRQALHRDWGLDEFIMKKSLSKKQGLDGSRATLRPLAMPGFFQHLPSFLQSDPGDGDKISQPVLQRVQGGLARQGGLPGFAHCFFLRCVGDIDLRQPTGQSVLAYPDQRQNVLVRADGEAIDLAELGSLVSRAGCRGNACAAPRRSGTLCRGIQPEFCLRSHSWPSSPDPGSAGTSFS